MRELIITAAFALVCGGYLAVIVWRLHCWFSFKNWAQVVALAISIAVLAHIFYSLFGYAWKNVDTYLPDLSGDVYLSAILLYSSFFLLIMTLIWWVQSSVRRQRKSRHSGLSRG